MLAFVVFCLSAGAAVLLWGRKPALPRAVNKSEARTTPDPPPEAVSAPLLLELLGTALDSGLSITGALHVVAQVAGEEPRRSLLQVAAGLEIGASWEDSWAGVLSQNVPANEALIQIYDALSFAALTGASAAPLLYAQAQQYRTAAVREAQKRAAALGVKLVLPLGLCSLPAFIAVGVVPVVMAMVPEL